MNAFEAGQYLFCGDYSSYTPTGKSYFVKAGRWHTSPKAGDIVYFYTESLGRVSHVGLVTRVTTVDTGVTINTMEGNTAAGRTFERDGGEFAEKVYTFSASQVGGTNRINGFGRPRYTDYGFKDTCSIAEMIAEARSWVGYAEKASSGTDAEMMSKSWNTGDRNFTWFGRVYGRWIGDSSAESWQWCQMSMAVIGYNAVKAARDTRSVKTGWTQDGGDWFYTKADSTLAKNEWLEIDGRWYVFDGSGRMAKGWYNDSTGAWYYMAGDGAMCASQWVSDSSGQFYLTASGAMAKNAYIRADKPDADGKYTYYYVGDGGAWDKSRDVSSVPDGLEVVA